MDNFKDVYLKNVPDSLKYLVPILDSVYRNDQKFRSVTDNKLYKKNKKRQDELDDKNLQIITKIIEKHGWLNIGDVGMVGAKAITMVMVHAGVRTKLKYYPFLIDAIRKRKIDYETVAVYEDKLNLMLRRQQYYGTQMMQYDGKFTLYPVIYFNELPSRRTMMGLMPIKQYLKFFSNPDIDLKMYSEKYSQIAASVKLTDSTPIHIDLRYILDSLKREKKDSVKIL
ncbi:MAG: hypothetical protein H7Y86_18345 [Rhizobacter sp.]|nr:hypothetical protein [Ferruginibacter sp.]